MNKSLEADALHASTSAYLQSAPDVGHLDEKTRMACHNEPPFHIHSDNLTSASNSSTVHSTISSMSLASTNVHKLQSSCISSQKLPKTAAEYFGDRVIRYVDWSSRR